VLFCHNLFIPVYYLKIYILKCTKVLVSFFVKLTCSDTRRLDRYFKKGAEENVCT
jgi:hypothetical protein